MNEMGTWDLFRGPNNTELKQESLDGLYDIPCREDCSNDIDYHESNVYDRDMKPCLDSD